LQDDAGQTRTRCVTIDHYIREGTGEEWEGRGGNGGRVKTGRWNQLFECSTHKGALSALPLHLVTLYLSIVCDDSGQVLCEEEEVRMRWKEYFASLLESDQNNSAQGPDHREGPRGDQEADRAGCRV
ncbi:MAG: hypothetical protein MPL62_14625, partial [Alphaproteobacteria bacterium]|nr:hypothetical protein [Alphaproteobacteria bacterium]